jgi:DNA-binding NtrC family response regulator
VAVVVLVSSDAGHRESWVVGLDARGHTIILASTGTAALDRVIAGGIDLLLVDYDVMGGIGHLMAGLARVNDAPPFVLISGAADAPSVSAHLGASAFLPKPCSINELAHAIGRITPSSGVSSLPTGPNRKSTSFDDSPTSPLVRGR